MTRMKKQHGETRIFAIRHAESVWNVLYRQHPNSHERYHPRMWTIDCDITKNGVQQAIEAGKKMSKDLGSIDLLIISPLRRELQTASLLLESFPTMPMEVVIARDATEVMVDPCDIGSSPEKLSQEFPTWDFSHLNAFWWHGGLSQEDTLALMIESKGLESNANAEERIEGFKAMLRSQDAGTIVIVCHGDFIWWLTRNPQNKEEQGLRVGNCEIVDVTDYIHQHSNDST